jgi:hypothetical protein
MRGAFIVREEVESAYRILFTIPQKNGPLRRYRRKWEGDIKIVFEKEVLKPPATCTQMNDGCFKRWDL